MTVQTLFFDAYTAYLTLVRNALNSAKVTVFDGPQLTYPGEKSFYAVGVDDISQFGQQTDHGRVTSIESGDQVYVGAGTPREETFTILSTLYAWDGMAAGITVVRANADAMLQAVAGAIRPAPYGTGDAMLGNVLNQGGDGTGWCGIAVTRMQQIVNGKGCAVSVQTALTCTARV